jgi:outer membrane protein TolC
MELKRLFIAVFMLFATFFSPYLIYAEEPLTLETSIDTALKNSSVLNMAREGTKGATAQKMEALTGFFPKFSTSYSYTRLNEAPFSRFQGLPPGPMYDMNGMEIPVGTDDNYNWAVEAKQPLFAGGAIWANYQANRIGEEAARLEEAARIQDVVQDVKIAYFNILRAQKIQDAARQSVEMLKAHRDVAENYFKVGMIPKNDLLYAEVELANGNQALVRAQNAVELAKSRFNTLLKRDIFTPVEVVDILAYQPLQKSFEECLNIARQSRPELKISALKAQQAGKLVLISQSEYYPALNLVGNYARFGDEASVDGSSFKDAESWYVMAVANWNFWEWGRTKFRVDADRARENQAIEASKELNDQITLEIKNAYLMLQEAEHQISVSQKLIEQAEENFRISEERYKEHVGTSTEVLDAQTLLTRAKSEYANALGDYSIHYAKLQRAMGNIWP